MNTPQPVNAPVNPAPEQAATNSPKKPLLDRQSFFEKLLLLLITAILTGLLIPYLTGRMQEQKAKAESLAQARAKLFEEASLVILSYETYLLDISWFKDPRADNIAMHEAAYHRYNEKAPEFLSTWRAVAAKAQTLASNEVANKLIAFHLEALKIQDTKMNELYNNKRTSTEEWRKLHNLNADMIGKANALISELAIDLDLAPAR